MTTAKQHYDELLGDHYTWSVAGDGDPFERPAAWLVRHALTGAARYLDLGAGFGAHVVPLVRLGAAVTAVDFHAGLLAELRAAAPSVATHEADLLAFLDAASDTWDAVLCLGDTLTHLPERAVVQRLLAGAARVLAPGGFVALSYRDYSGPPRAGLDRFIPVRSDPRRSLLCCVELADADRVAVTDILTTASPDGLRTRLSTYHKLRLAPAEVTSWAATAGLTLERSALDQAMLLQVFRAI
ncbi:MAG: class I SAM-dependent methyltransferase [Kofleriaceae bacterium]